MPSSAHSILRRVLGPGLAFGTAISLDAAADRGANPFEATPLPPKPTERASMRDAACGEGKCGEETPSAVRRSHWEGACGEVPAKDCIRFSQRPVTFYHPAGWKRMRVLENVCPDSLEVDIRWSPSSATYQQWIVRVDPSGGISLRTPRWQRGDGVPVVSRPHAQSRQAIDGSDSASRHVVRRRSATGWARRGRRRRPPATCLDCTKVGRSPRHLNSRSSRASRVGSRSDAVRDLSSTSTGTASEG